MEIKNFITHCADIQVKSRNINLYEETNKVLHNIENKVAELGSKIHIISGDLFEYASPNEDERRLIYNHIARLLNIDTLELLIIISGNHDLTKENKKDLVGNEINAIGVLASLLSNLTNNDKLMFLTRSMPVNINIKNIDVCLLPYCLEDKENWINLTNHDTSNDNLTICLYHAMIREYAEYAKLPINTSKLDSLDIFPDNSYIMAGDIHKNLRFTKDNRVFIYPGSTMQHTYSEGSYIDINNDYLIKHAEHKSIEVYDYKDNKLINRQEFLTSEIDYVTISLDSSIDISVIKYNIERINVELRNETYRIKVKSSNIFIKHEQEIFEILRKKFDGCNKLSIAFEYDKFVQTNTFTDNKTINEFIIDKQKSLTTDNQEFVINQSNIDNLLLNNEQLSKLFMELVKSALEKNQNLFDKNLTEESVYSSLSDLFQEQLQCATEKSHKRYNIKFKSVFCNSFMILGPTCVKLDDAGIIRIIGTNGIGKTTLYRLIRWIITGQINDGMKNNQTVQNNLLVFNKNLPNENYVNGKLQLEINNQPIIIERIISHEWKQNTSEEQKYSQNWQDFVTNFKREFILKIFKNSEDQEPKIYKGEQAEKVMLSWFGSTINNLLFLDQTKIKQILNTQSKDLNNLILDYIGVDYLEKLENQLDSVKEKLMTIRKPTDSVEIISEKIIDCKITIDKCESEINGFKTELESLNVENQENKDSLNQIINRLLELGDINKLIDGIQSKINDLNESINSMSQHNLEKREEPVFDLSEPTKDFYLLDSYYTSLKQINEEKESIESELEQIKTNEQKVRAKYVVEFKSLMNEITEQLNQEHESLHTNNEKIHKLESDLIAKCYDKLELINQKDSEKSSKLSELELHKKQLQEKIEQYKYEIKSGYCPTCKRKYDNFTQEDIDKLKQQIIDAENQISEIDTEIYKINNWKQRSIDVKNEIKRTIEYIKVFLSKNMHQRESVIPSNHTINFIKEYKSIFMLLCELDKKRVESDDNICILNTKQRLLNNTQNEIFSEKFETDFETLKIINNEYLEVSKQINEIKSRLNNCIEKINSFKSKIEEYNKQFEEKLNDYYTAYKNHTNLCNQIKTYNEEIDETLHKIKALQKTINDYQKELDGATKNKLPKYLSLKDNKTILENKINQTESAIKNKIEEIHLRELIHQAKLKELKDFELKYTEYIQYVRNKLVWSIYSTLIKKNFKEVVFEYYRTFLNNTLNYLLSDVNFKLYWNKESELMMVNCKDGIVTYQPVQTSSGMETTFLGLSLIYTMHLLNVKNTVSNLFIDEISGTLNKGKELSYDAQDYQELFVKILSKFVDKTIFIVDHSIDNLNESVIYEVIPQDKFSIYERK